MGHLRRTATIARRIRALAADRRLHLVSNARPDGLSSTDIGTFDTVQVVERDRMALDLAVDGKMVLVLDTITVPGIEQLDAQLVLVLREAPDAQLHRFRLADRRPWDLVIVANPRNHWMPADGSLTTRAAVAVGWIYRPAGAQRQSGEKMFQLLVATGGGGTAETASRLYAEIDALLARVRQQSPVAFEVIQAVGPRALAFGRLATADRIVDPGAELNDLFGKADAVISTAGYNSVLELATTDTPALLVPILRSIDDQAARARLWAQQIGCWHDVTAPELSVDWLTQVIASRRRRRQVDLGPSGEDQAATAILNLE
ncbi:MAG: glycosyltransferase [Paracoccaceae bacterium]